LSGGIDLASADPRDALSMLLDRENITSIINSTDGLEKLYQKHFNAKTERVDPFTFKFNRKESIPFDSAMVETQLATHINKRFAEFSRNNKDRVDGEMKISDYGSLTDMLEEGFRKGDKSFAKSSGITALLMNTKGLKSQALPEESRATVQEFLSKHGLNSLGYVDANVDHIQQTMTKKLKEEPDFAGKEDIRNFFMRTEPGAMVPAINILKSKHSLPVGLQDAAPNVLKHFQGTVSGISDILKASGDVESTIYVSRNPMNILTMSPEKTMPSCQSLTLAISKGEIGKTATSEKHKINIDNNNINIPASYNA
jgi:hypothetical protein